MDCFECTDSGPVTMLLGYEITRNLEEQTTKMSQGRYIQKLLTRFGMESIHPVATPLDPNVSLNRPDLDTYILTDIPYREVIGSLQYATTATRPDIAYPIGLLSRFLDKPKQRHWTAAKRILRTLPELLTLVSCFENPTRCTSLLVTPTSILHHTKLVENLFLAMSHTYIRPAILPTSSPRPCCTIVTKHSPPVSEWLLSWEGVLEFLHTLHICGYFLYLFPYICMHLFLWPVAHFSLSFTALSYNMYIK